MKRFLLSGCSMLVLSAIAVPAVQAQVTAEAPPSNAATLGMEVTPYNLVFLAYQGFFESEGIPKFNRLYSDFQAGRVSAQDLVRVAISMRRLTPDMLNNQGYLRSVERQLNSLYTDDSN